MKQRKLVVYDAGGDEVLEVKGRIFVHGRHDSMLPSLSHSVNVLVNRKFAGNIFIDKDWTFTIEEVHSSVTRTKDQ